MIDALAFWAEAAARTHPGERVDPRLVPGSQGWPYGQALAGRLGFRQSAEFPGTYISQRNAASLGLRWVGSDDYAAWLTLFRRCFGHEISQRHWDWKYRGSDRRGVGVTRGQQLVAFYGGMPRELRASGAPWRGIQVGDVMVDPDWRASLSRRGPFQMAASTFLEQMLGPGGPHHVGFGFPNARAMKVAHKLGLYRAVDEVVELAWSAHTAQAGRLTVCTPVDSQEACRHGDALWQEMQKALPETLLGVRDAGYLHWRYVQHPAHAHRWLLLRSRLTRRVMGLVVYRQESSGRWEILDLVGDPRCYAALIRGVQAEVPSTEGQEVFMWMTRSHMFWLADSRPAVRALEVMVPTSVWVPPNHPGSVDGRWWLTGGDTDFR
jgi:hypothetical protein